MPKTGDYYTVSLKEAHMDWGRHRYTHTRERIEGEAMYKSPKDTPKCMVYIKATSLLRPLQMGFHPLRHAQPAIPLPEIS